MGPMGVIIEDDAVMLLRLYMMVNWFPVAKSLAAMDR